jgi:hypothetical protein
MELKSGESERIRSFNADFGQIIQSFENLNAAFVAHPFVVPIVAQMINPTRNRIIRLTWTVSNNTIPPHQCYSHLIAFRSVALVDRTFSNSHC